MKKLISKAIGVLGLSTMPLLALAQTDWEYSYNYDSTTSDAASAGVAALGIGMIIIWCVAMLIGLAFLIFWIIMLVDCVKRQFEQRTTWLIVLIVGFFIGLHWLGAILYYFMVKRKNLGTKAGPKPAAPKP